MQNILTDGYKTAGIFMPKRQPVPLTPLARMRLKPSGHVKRVFYFGR